MSDTNPSGADPLSSGSPPPTQTAEVGVVAVVTAEAPAADDGGATPVVETASDFKQLYTLTFCCLAIFIATVALPIEGRNLDLYAKDAISGGFLAVFSAYGVLAGWMNIHSRKMIVWPAFFAAADGIYLCTMRAMQLTAAEKLPKPAEQMDGRDWIHQFGSGFYVIALMSLLVLWTLLSAVMSGAKKEAARKEAAKAARGTKR